jgi:hypothetical protein
VVVDRALTSPWCARITSGKDSTGLFDFPGLSFTGLCQIRAFMPSLRDSR